MKKVVSAILSIIVLITSLGLGCGGPRALTIGEQQLVESSNTFGFELFKEVVDQEGDKNIFISPLSVSMALGMTLNGADGDTYEAMSETLELAGLTEDEINKSYESLIELLSGLDPEVIFQIANSIWYRQGFPVKESFLDICQQYFDAGAEELDFDDPGAVDTINSWVNENTDGKIEGIVDPPINPLTIMFLINAIYFNGNWKYQFDEQDTRSETFYLTDGSESECQMMVQHATLSYYRSDTFQAVDLPYGNGKYSMTVLLPAQNNDIDNLIANLNDISWNDWMARLVDQELRLYLPKFTLEYDLLMNDVLKAMGMEVAFTRWEANFGRMLDLGHVEGPLYIDKVKHKTFVKVNEEGTEAAAVTSVEMVLEGAPPSMRVNRPFIFLIRENHSGSILFAGKIVEPVWEE
jgi:serpin B